MNISNIFRLKKCTVYFYINPCSENLHNISITVKKDHSEYQVLNNYTCELSKPSIEIESQYDSDIFLLIVTESGLEWSDTLLRVEIKPECDYLSLFYGSTSECFIVKI